MVGVVRSQGLVASIVNDLGARYPEQRKTQREKLSVLVAAMLESRSANLMDLAAALPRPVLRHDMRYQYVERFLSNEHVDPDAVMVCYGREVFARLTERGQTLVLSLDQSWINERFVVVMVSVRLGDRALPVAWRVVATQGNVPFKIFKGLLAAVQGFVPTGIPVLLAGDRFYGTAEMINWCQAVGWSYRLRLKGSLLVEEAGGESNLDALAKDGTTAIPHAKLTSGAITHIGILHEKGHPEPWIIAMDTIPTKATTLDYGLRWSIEAMFSDFKSRGFGLAQTQLQSPDKVARLILIMAVALYWATSIGIWDKQHNPSPKEKRGPRRL
jgi:Transposase DDE domain